LDTTMHKAKTKHTTICVGHHHTQGEDKTNHNMCWTPPYTRRRQNTPQYVLDTTMHKAKTKHTTICVGHHHAQGEDKTNHNMCWTPPYTRRRQNTPQYVLDTTMHKAKTKQTTTHNMLDTTIFKQTQITYVCFRFDRNSIFITYMFILLITGYQYLNNVNKT
jgi:alpha-D-ribose 1-methylphosphonate 5-triphosphate synthase subunit PhnG